MKKFISKILQKFADKIIINISKAKTKADVILWYNIGIKLNNWCILRNIWLK